MVAIAFAANFGQVVFFNPTLGVFVTPLSEEFGWTRAQLSLAITAGGLGAGLSSPLIGMLIDRRGARWVVPPAAVAMGLCLLALSEMRSLWQLYVFYALGRGLAVGAVSAAAIVVVSNWFVRRRALAVAVSSVGLRLGMAALPLLAATVMAATGDFRDGWRALAIVILLLGVVPPLFAPRRPEDVGLRPDGAPRSVEADTASAQRDEDWTLREALSTRAYWLLGVALALIFLAGGSINFHQIPHLEDQGLDRTTAALVVTVFSLVGAVGGLLGGAVATRLRARWTLAGSLLGQAGGVVLLITAGGVASAMVFAVSYGVFFGSMFTMNQIIYAEYFGRRSLGVIRGSFQPVVLTANAAGPFLAGLWFDHTGSYVAPFSIFAVCFLLAAVALAFAPYPRHEAQGPTAARG